MPSIFDVADYILRERGPTPPLKLQIMCFHAQGRHLGLTHGTALFMQEFYAHPTCPICPELAEIKSPNYMLEATDIPPDKLTDTLTPLQQAMIDHVLTTYDLHGAQIMAGGTRLERPWRDADSKRLTPANPNTTDDVDKTCPLISKDSIYECYR